MDPVMPACSGGGSARNGASSPSLSHAIEMSRQTLLVEIERAAPWRTKVSSMLAALKSPEEIRGLRSSALRRYYLEQNELIEFYEAQYLSLKCPSVASTYREEPASGLARAAITGSFILNVGLLAVKIVGVGISGSMALLASVIDSCLDVFSGMVLFATRLAIDHTDPYKYPQGKRRLEPLGVLVFSVVMSVASLQIIRESAERLIEGLLHTPYVINVDLTVEAIVAVTVASKLVACILCTMAYEATRSSAVRAYAKDHANDTMSNMVGTGGLLLAHLVPKLWYMDPLAGIVISVFIFAVWVSSTAEQIDHMIGKVAERATLKKLIFMAMNHDEDVRCVETARAYHFGERVLVEVDIVLPRSMRLDRAHDIGEGLQCRIEDLRDVERCFVHLDTNCRHLLEHKGDNV